MANVACIEELKNAILDFDEDAAVTAAEKIIKDARTSAIFFMANPPVLKRTENLAWPRRQFKSARERRGKGPDRRGG